jgi:hypothetical protein
VYSRNRQAQREKLGDLREWIVESAPDIAQYLLPLGEEMGGSWCVGNIGGDQGKSLRINLSTGWWKDYNPAEGAENQQDLIALWMQVRRVDFRTAITEIKSFLKGESVMDRSQVERQAAARTKRRERALQTKRAAERERHYFNDSVFGSYREQLANWRGWRVEFCSWLIHTHAIGKYGEAWCIPRRDETGLLESIQYLKQEEPRAYAFYPSGSPTRSYILGNPKTANHTSRPTCSESLA